MSRSEIVAQMTKAFGRLPSWIADAPDEVLAQYWSTLSWVLRDTALSGKEKALVAFGAAAATHCEF